MQGHCVSAVVPVRHDNWGGGLALRAQTTLPHLAAAFDELLSFKDRIARDGWIDQAKQLHEQKYGEAL